MGLLLFKSNVLLILNTPSNVTHYPLLLHVTLQFKVTNNILHITLLSLNCYKSQPTYLVLMLFGLRLTLIGDI